MTERVGGSLIENDGGEHRGRVTPTRQSCDVIEGKEREKERERFSPAVFIPSLESPRRACRSKELAIDCRDRIENVIRADNRNTMVGRDGWFGWMVAFGRAFSAFFGKAARDVGLERRRFLKFARASLRKKSKRSNASREAFRNGISC